MVTLHCIGQNGEAEEWKHNCQKELCIGIWSHRYKKRSELGIQLGTSKQGKGEGREGSWY